MQQKAPISARDRILSTADRLFYSTGVRAVGVDRVIAEAGVAKMTFFRHFPTKDDLVVTFLEQREQASQAELTRLRTADPDGPRAVLHTIASEISTITAGDGFRGCEFINTAAEFADSSHRAREVVHRHRAWIRDLMSESLTALGHPTPAATAELLLMLRTGAIVAASLEGFTDDGAFERAWWSLIEPAHSDSRDSASINV